MLQVCTFASGSKGNCTLVTDGKTHILIDAGISARRITTALQTVGLSPGDLSGVLITHEHGDHIAGLATLTKHFRLPVYASRGTSRTLTYRIAFPDDVLRPFVAGTSFCIDSLHLETFSTSHDAADSTGYTVTDGKRKAAVTTDLGYVSDAVRAAVAGSHLLMVETNHDEDMVRGGGYPPFLQARILGDEGHLSNHAGAALAAACVQDGASTILLAHLSQQNNIPRLAHEIVAAALRGVGVDDERGVTLAVAPASAASPLYAV
ncbi:MAG: MBL fold metallo-hydrolase [Oscillospiraceae bacterium]|nr:MBL fold metallo-hydrolase [Oscillospiraceae bacterium]